MLSVSKCESSTVFCEAGYKKLVRNFTRCNLSTVDFINHCMFVYFTFIFHVCRAYGNAKHCRKLFQRVLNSVSDWPESISEAYMQFEREEGKYFIDSLFYGLFYCTLSVNCVSKKQYQQYVCQKLSNSFQECPSYTKMVCHFFEPQCIKSTFLFCFFVKSLPISVFYVELL